VRVSTRAPRAKPAAGTVKRASNLAVGLLEAVIGQLADYIETSPAVERLIRAQTTKVLRELARDPEFTALLRAQADQYISELISQPEILEPLVQEQVDRYLAKSGKKRLSRRKPKANKSNEIPIE
jgi:hypothetical protein